MYNEIQVMAAITRKAKAPSFSVTVDQDSIIVRRSRSGRSSAVSTS